MLVWIQGPGAMAAAAVDRLDLGMAAQQVMGAAVLLEVAVAMV